MTRIGFFITGSREWIAGLNYLKNLLIGISSLESKTIQPVVLIKKDQKDIIPMFEPYGEILPYSVNRYSLSRLVKRVANKTPMFNFDILDGNGLFIKRNRIDVMAYSGIFLGRRSFKVVNWVPDFQHLHMPEMFSPDEIIERNVGFRDTIQHSDAVIVSSHDALEDFTRFSPQSLHKAWVLPFVAQIDPLVYEMDSIDELQKKYHFMGKYFFLPNQLWKHKNHMVVFKAVKYLKERGADVLVICTGHLNDYRHKNYKKEISSFIAKNKLESNIRLLGLVDYSDVIRLFRHSISVLNPSLFEGWSTSVEEAKSMGKGMIVSDIRVHREQDPPGSVFFNPNNHIELAEIMMNAWKSSDGGPDFVLEENARKAIAGRTREFGVSFQNIINMVL